MRIRKTPPKEFTIDRSKWVHGGNEDILGVTSLLNDEGNMCCLGFYSKVCGATNSSMLNKDNPLDLGLEIPLMGDGSDDYNDIFMDTCITINDSGGMDKRDREKELKAAFKGQGVKAKFVGRYPKGVV